MLQNSDASVDLKGLIRTLEQHLVVLHDPKVQGLIVVEHQHSEPVRLWLL